ncbi:hypothetical protein MHPYR_230070 [uncultured Mycobacterium sp.]|uniref:Uncharacterized protein n=1 Tax=uncultured Mycobacterium sp. TaxID=171292 RepID=A0A1Y5PDH4_9MYCO|nr:hypothetical protein MHPYR_230070 [uncultured Mycobacterium sp.]
MAVEAVQAHEVTVSKSDRSLHRASMRSALIVGVTALGIASAAPDGVITSRQEGPTAVVASITAPKRVSDQGVELMAYIPGWTDAMIANRRDLTRS